MLPSMEPTNCLWPDACATLGGDHTWCANCRPPRRQAVGFSLGLIHRLAEEILNNSHSEHDVRLWAGEILSLVANLQIGDTNVAPRNR